MAQNVNSKQIADAVPTGQAVARPARLDLVFTALTVIGIGISGYLSWAHLTYTPIICTADLSCDTVNRSAYAYFPPTWGIPVSYLGLVAYLALFGLIIWRMRVARQAVLVGGNGLLSRVDLGLFVATLLGLIFSAYLTAMELFVIHAVCWWCVGSATVITILFGIATARIWTGNEY
ncbi:MAG: vitamin K epoxide reductase family protein [Chloroflexi bacterium]|nr:vitamin K epoxide reductase family protein [Chloroflexota bacterium]OJV91995.1 MAG: hypothetical protein BGO39_12885 [Chloroflexi bacterium 54-19]